MVSKLPEYFTPFALSTIFGSLTPAPPSRQPLCDDRRGDSLEILLRLSWPSQRSSVWWNCCPQLETFRRQILLKWRHVAHLACVIAPPCAFGPQARRPVVGHRNAPRSRLHGAARQECRPQGRDESLSTEHVEQTCETYASQYPRYPLGIPSYPFLCHCAAPFPSV